MIKKLLYPSLAIAVLIVQSLIIYPQAAYAGIDPGLQLHWNFEEGSGTVATDDSGHGNDGTIYNGASYVQGRDGLAISLDGNSQYVQVNNPLASLGTPDQPYALSAWVKVPQGVTQGNIVHISSAPDGSGWCIPFLRMQNDVFAATSWDTTNGANGEEDAVGSTQAQSDQWYQVLTSWDSVNGLRLFVDGSLEATTPQADYDASGVPMYVSVGMGSGACSEDQGYLYGDVDDVRIYSRALTPSDIQAISTEGDPAPPSPSTQNSAPATTTSAAATTAPATSVNPPDTGFGTSAANNRPEMLVINGSLLISFVLVVAGLRSLSKDKS